MTHGIATSARSELLTLDDLEAAAEEGLEANLVRFLGFLGGTYPTELQVLDCPIKWKENWFAHATSESAAIQLAKTAEDWNAVGCYLILNEIDPAIATRARPDTWHNAKKGASTTDTEIRMRRAVFMDVDARRAKGTSATDDELEYALEIAFQIAELLGDMIGSHDSIGVGHSGNGGSVFIALDHIGETADVASAVKEILSVLDVVFSDEFVHLDCSVSDAKRLCPLYGTTKRKGAEGVAERPHRRTAFVCSDEVHRLSRDELLMLRDQMLAELTDDERTKVVGKASAQASTTGAQTDTRFGRAKAVSVSDVAEWLGLVDGDQLTCPGCGSVGGGNTGVQLFKNHLKCHHGRCAEKGIKGLRSNIDLVMEVRQVSNFDAVKLIEEKFGLPDRITSKPNDDRPPFELMGAYEIFLSPLPPIQHLVPELDIAPGAPTSISAYGFVGKTTIAQDMAVEIATFDLTKPGESQSALGSIFRTRRLWGMFEVVRGGPVLHLDYEVGSHLTKTKYRRLLRARGIDPAHMQGRLSVAIHPRAYLHDPEKVEQALVELCSGYVLCVVDSLRASAPRLEENSSEMRGPQDLLNRVSEKTGCTFVVLTHGKKPSPGGNGNSTYDQRGSSAIFDAAGCHLVVTSEEKDAPKAVEHKKAKNNGVLVDDFEIVIEDVEIDGDPRAGLRVTARRPGSGVSHDGRPVDWDNDRSEKKAKIVECIARFGEVASKNAVIEELGGKRERMNGVIDLLVTEGVLRKNGFALSLSADAIMRVDETKARVIEMLTKTRDADATKRELGINFKGLEGLGPFNGRAPYDDLRRWHAGEGLDIYVLAACAAGVKEGRLEERTQHLPIRWTGVALKGWVPWTPPQPQSQPPESDANLSAAGVATAEATPAVPKQMQQPTVAKARQRKRPKRPRKTT